MGIKTCLFVLVVGFLASSCGSEKRQTAWDVSSGSERDSGVERVDESLIDPAPSQTDATSFLSDQAAGSDEPVPTPCEAWHGMLKLTLAGAPVRDQTLAALQWLEVSRSSPHRAELVEMALQSVEYFVTMDWNLSADAGEYERLVLVTSGEPDVTASTPLGGLALVMSSECNPLDADADLLVSGISRCLGAVTPSYEAIAVIDDAAVAEAPTEVETVVMAMFESELEPACLQVISLGGQLSAEDQELVYSSLPSRTIAAIAAVGESAKAKFDEVQAAIG